MTPLIANVILGTLLVLALVVTVGALVFVVRSSRTVRMGKLRAFALGATAIALPASALGVAEFFGMPLTIYCALPSVPFLLSVGVLSFILLGPQATRTGARSWLLGSTGALLTAVLFLIASVFLREAGFKALAVRSRPLVAALNAYVAQHGAAPAGLDELVPRYLPEVPGTRMPLSPEFEYSVLESGMWQLLVPCSLGLLNWDVFLYWPTQDYPPNMLGGWVEERKGWAYVHE